MCTICMKINYIHYFNLVRDPDTICHVDELAQVYLKCLTKQRA